MRVQSFLRSLRAARAPALALLSPLLLTASSPLQVAEDPGWPRQIDVPAGRVVIYQPQPESFEGTALSARAAVSVTRSGATEPVFGAVWVTARVDTDRDERTVQVRDVVIDRVRFPNATQQQEDSLSDLLEAQIPRWNLTISLDRLLTSLEQVERAQASATDVSATPPAIEFVDEPTVLVTIDGEPRLQAVDGSSLMRVLNTPFTILLSSDSGTYYLFTGDERWYQANDLRGAWELAPSVPRYVAELAPEPPPDSGSDEDEPAEAGAPPAIRIATEPTELIVTTGEPEYSPLSGTDLLYMTNTASDVLLEIGSQRHFIILSGRWYVSESLAGPWSHVPPGELPPSFGRIPPESEMGHLLISVPGTDEAREAVMDHQIPQTSAIQRSAATLQVTYDGEPQFVRIEGGDLEYAINTSYSVIRAGAVYYACHEAVWFTSNSAQGPWRVADAVPDEIYSIPPSEPVHNVTYVHIYDTTPDVVYVGYFPGYMHSYVYGGTIVYGTGYYYPPWFGTVYYPYPATWGFHMRYNPWYGWGFGFSYSTGPFTFAIGWHGGYGGYWGPAGYRGYHHGYHRGWHEGYRAGAGAGYRAGFRAGTRVADRQNNIYNRPQNRARNVSRPSAASALRPSAVPRGSNNVFADRDGNVHRRIEDGWQTRGRDGWTPSNTVRDRAGGLSGRSRTELDRSNLTRQRGSARAGNFQRSRSRPSGRRR